MVCWTVSKHPRHETNFYKPDIKYSISPSPYLKTRRKKEKEKEKERGREEGWKQGRKEMTPFNLG